mgnify:CR=1 FL=1
MLRRLPDGQRTETVGYVAAHGDGTVSLDTRRGEVVVEVDSVEVWRKVRSWPWRIANFLRRGPVAVIAPDVAELRPMVKLCDELRSNGIKVLSGDPREPEMPSGTEDTPLSEIRFVSADLEAVNAARARGWQARQYTAPH